MSVTYKMVQVPTTIEVNQDGHKGNEAAVYLEKICNDMAAKGWTFFRVDQLAISVKPGCISALFGQKNQTYINYVITFQKNV